ncbi:hypothetical protein [Pseudonocardia sp. ICBG1293]|uniref:hypothetical protein n=1 Tax=Pseudonocardia sp. ICBG1293 TaxID=2844382 RepID=UPI001CC920A0|nr:hypothetical protein [Pseudonocardia sp. ICBG1293]
MSDPAGQRPGPVPPDGGDGSGLARRQAELVAALVAGGADPPGFDAGRLAAARAALRRKRAGLVAAQWPLLAADAGADWQARFDARFDGVAPYGAQREGWDLARELAAAGGLGPGARRELAAREAALHYDGATAPRPRNRVARWWRRSRLERSRPGSRGTDG